MNESNGSSLLLDRAVLDRLLIELEGDEGIWTVFLRDYLSQLPHRIERIRLTLTTGDVVSALDAALSLKTSSQMIGAERMAGYALTLELAIRQHKCDDDPAVSRTRLAANTLRQLHSCAELTGVLLEEHLRRPDVT